MRPIRASLAGILTTLLLASAIPVAGAPKPEAAVRLILALDTSGSMKANDPERLLPRAAALIMHLLEVQDSLGLLRFDTVPAMVLEPGPLTQARRRQGLQQLGRLLPRGEFTDIPAALEAALKSFAAMPDTSGRALVLITDGHIDLDPRKNPPVSWGERLRHAIIPAYQRAQIVIYPVAFTAEADQALLRELAAATRGEFFLAERADDLHNVMVRIYENLKKPQLAPFANDKFFIDAGVAEAVLIASREEPNRAVTLTDPLGRQLTPKDAPGQVRWFATPAFDLVTIPQPSPGVWSLRGCKAGEGKMALHTDLKLVCPHLPAEIASDEELVAGALLREGDRAITHGELLEQAVFKAELSLAGGEASRLELGAVPADQQELWPPGARVGRFPPLRSPGKARLRVWVIGKTFQRERNFLVRVGGPWYREKVAGGTLTFLPTAQPPPGIRHGWLCVQPGSGGLAARLFRPPEPGDFSLALPVGGPPPLKGDLRLSGGTPEGRPLIIRPVIPAVAPAAIAGEKSPPAPPFKSRIERLANSGRRAASFLRTRNPWLLAALGVWLLLVAGCLGWQAYHHWPVFRLPDLRSFLSGAVGTSGQERLLLLARVENLEKEKLAIQGELEQMSQKLRQAVAENAELLAKMEQQSLKFQDKARLISELEQKLADAANEAKAVQQEYMALYARSQAEKGVLEKN